MSDRASKAVERPRSVSPTGRAGSAAPGPAAPGPAAPGPAVGEVLDAVAKAVGEIEYGSVLIKIHQGAVVGIETSTKVRLKGT